MRNGHPQLTKIHPPSSRRRLKHSIAEDTLRSAWLHNKQPLRRSSQEETGRQGRKVRTHTANFCFHFHFHRRHVSNFSKVSSSSSEASSDSDSSTSDSEPQNGSKTAGNVAKARESASPSPAGETSAFPSQTSKADTEQAFESFYLRQAAKEFSDDLDKLRGASDFKGQSSVELLVGALKQGGACFSGDERKRVGGNRA